MPLLAETTNSGGAFLLVMFFLLFGLLFFGLVIYLFVLWILMLIDALSRNDWQNEDERLTWIIVLVVSMFIQLWGIAAVVYYFVIKKPRAAMAPSAPEEAQIVTKPVKKKPATKTKKITKKGR